MYQQNEQLPQTTVPQKTTPYDVTSDPGLEHAQMVAENMYCNYFNASKNIPFTYLFFLSFILHVKHSNQKKA
jgi:hypothetical protein